MNFYEITTKDVEQSYTAENEQLQKSSPTIATGYDTHVKNGIFLSDYNDTTSVRGSLNKGQQLLE